MTQTLRVEAKGETSDQSVPRRADANQGTRVAGFFPSMKVRLTKKLADQLDGINVADHREGDILDLSPREAKMLVEERWALPERRDRFARDTGQRCRADDYRRKSRRAITRPFRSSAR
jgi:hypothetical protein